MILAPAYKHVVFLNTISLLGNSSMSETEPLVPDRRLEPRLYGLYPLWVHVKHDPTQVSTSYTIADNISSGGLYFRFPNALPVNTHLSVLIQLPKGIKIAARGHIVRQKSQAHGLTGLAMRFSRTRIMPLFEQ